MSHRHLATTLELVADVVPEQTAFVHGDLRRSWREFDLRAARLAAAIQAMGVGVGDTVAIAMYNCPQWLEAFYAALKIRAVPANVNYRYRDEEMRYLLEDCSAVALVFHASLADTLQCIRDRLSNIRLWIMVDDTGQPIDMTGIYDIESLILKYKPAARIERPETESYISYTGGTTGLPKGVLYRLSLTTLTAPRFVNHIFGKSFDTYVDTIEVATQLRDEGVQLISVVAPPLMHSTGLSITAIPTLAVGGTVVTMATTSFNPHHTLAEIERTAANRLTIVGDAFARPLLAALEEGRPGGGAYDCESLRLVASSGAALTASSKEQLLKHWPQVVLMESCGATEGVSLGVRVNRRGDRLKTASFTAAPGVMVVDEKHNPLPRQIGCDGLLAGPAVTTGYLNDPQKTAERYTSINGVLYAIPGDYGRLEADGTLTLLGRGATVINTGGEKVYPEEVEDRIKHMRGVFDALVIGMPDERLGQKVTAVVHTTGHAGLSGEKIREYVKQHLAGYKAPRQIVFVEGIPRGPNGKADYPKVRQLLDEALSSDDA